jgi:hypothetical protein
VAVTEAELRALLPRVQSGEFRAKLALKHPARPIWEQFRSSILGWGCTCELLSDKGEGRALF